MRAKPYRKIAVVFPQSFHLLFSARRVDCGGQQDVDNVSHDVYRVVSQVRVRGGRHVRDVEDPLYCCRTIISLDLARS